MRCDESRDRGRLKTWLRVTLMATAVVTPHISRAQTPTPIPRLGLLEPGPSPTQSVCHLAFRRGLRDLGYVEGQNIALDARYASGKPNRVTELAAELVALKPDVIWTHSTPAAIAAKQATTSIPIITGVANNLVEEGLVASLGRPGGNLSGLELRDLELLGRRLQLLKQAVPTVVRVAVLVNSAFRPHDRVPDIVETEARALGLRLQRVEARTAETFDAAFALIIKGGADALVIMDSADFTRERQRLLALAIGHRLPTMSAGRQFAEAGSLISYGANVSEMCRRSAAFVDKVLKGASPASLPVERADRFDFVVNLRTAKALGLSMPQSILLLADEVIR